MHPLPKAFIEGMKNLLGEADAILYEEALHTLPPVSVRINPKKPFFTLPEGALPVAWCNTGYYLPKRPIFAADPLWHAGAYYVQEAASMLLCSVWQQLGINNHQLRVLDLCAAPGGKSTLLAAQLAPNSLLVANETIKSRAAILQENITKWGSPNVIITSSDAAQFAPLAGYFDWVLVDAPCSGEGLFRKDPDAIAQWSPENVTMCAARQKRILAEAAPLVKAGGWLCYSTCTFQTCENEDNGIWLLQNEQFQSVRLSFPASWGITETITTASNGKMLYGYRCYPHKTQGEGFFLTVFQAQTDSMPPSLPRPDKYRTAFLSKKEGDLLNPYLNSASHEILFFKHKTQHFAFPAALAADFVLLQKHLYLKQAGVCLGEWKGKDFICDHHLAMSEYLPTSVERLQVPLRDALLYLQRNEFDTPSASKGWHVVTYNNCPLGWIKTVGDRANNYYPKEWRLLRDFAHTTTHNES